MEIFKHKFYPYSKYHKEHSALMSHIEKLKKRGLKLVEMTDKKTPNAYNFVIDNDKGGYWLVYRFKENDQTKKIRVGTEFYYRESVDGKGIVKITERMKHISKKPELDTFKIEGVNFKFQPIFETFNSIYEMLDDGDLTFAK